MGYMDTEPDNWGTVWPLPFPRPHQLASLQSLFSPLHGLCEFLTCGGGSLSPFCR